MVRPFSLYEMVFQRLSGLVPILRRTPPAPRAQHGHQGRRRAATMSIEAVAVAAKLQEQSVSNDQEDQRRSVIGRVARILSAFDRQQRSMPLTVLAQRADLPVPTAYRLVTELIQHGLLERGPD